MSPKYKNKTPVSGKNSAANMFLQTLKLVAVIYFLTGLLPPTDLNGAYTFEKPILIIKPTRYTNF